MHEPRRVNSFPLALITPGFAWSRFTYSRDDMELLGVVQIGIQIGALARLPTGDYVQVNGDFISTLDTAQLRPGLVRAGLLPSSTTPHAGAGLVGAPIVTIKKRRRIAEPAG